MRLLGDTQKLQGDPMSKFIMELEFLQEMGIQNKNEFILNKNSRIVAFKNINCAINIRKREGYY